MNKALGTSTMGLLSDGKQTDDRFFAIVNESGKNYLTWGKGNDAGTMMQTEQRYNVKGITVRCKPGDAGDVPDAKSFTLQLPRNTPVANASTVRPAQPSFRRNHADSR